MANKLEFRSGKANIQTESVFIAKDDGTTVGDRIKEAVENIPEELLQIPCDTLLLIGYDDTENFVISLGGNGEYVRLLGALEVIKNYLMTREE